MTEPRITPADIGDVFHEVDQEVSELQAYWNTFREMFKEQASVDVFNDRCPSAGHVIEMALIEIIILKMTRLCDPAETRGGKDKNLSLERVINELPSAAKQELSDDLRDKLFAINDALRVARVHRDKRIAHLDLTYAIDKTKRLPALMLDTLAQALERIREFMNMIYMSFRGYGTSYEGLMLTGGGGDLVHALYMARNLDKLSSKIMRGATKDEIYESVRLGGVELTDDPAS